MLTVVRSDRGMALVVIIFVGAILLTLTGASLLFSSLDLKATSAMKDGTIALQVADAGIHHALSVIPPGTSFSYSTDPNSPTCVVPSSSCSTNKFEFGGGYSYTVTAINTAGNSQAILTATAFGPNGTKKVVVAYIGRGSYGLGAIHAPGLAANIETQFAGTSFSLNGNDQCGTASAVPGISTTDSALVTEITNNDLVDGGLTSDQMGRVVGAGSAPSVTTIQESSPSVSDLAVQYLDQTHDIVTGTNFAGGANWGTADDKRITLVSGDSEIQVGGNITGYGVLILDGSLRISGNFTFHGLVIARGDIQFLGGNATIYGSLLIAESADLDPTVELSMAGNAVVRYDSCALSQANSWVPLPNAARLVAWQEKLA